MQDFKAPHQVKFDLPGTAAEPVETPSQKLTITRRRNPVSPDFLDTGIGERLRALRVAANLTQTDLAAKIGCTSSSVCDIETSKSTNPSIGKIRALAAVLDVHPAQLLLSEEEISEVLEARCPNYAMVGNSTVLDMAARLDAVIAEQVNEQVRERMAAAMAALGIEGV